MSASYQFDRKGEPIEAAPGGQPDAVQGSAALRDRLLAHFATWERQNGFKHGAGIILLPAGWQP